MFAVSIVIVAVVGRALESTVSRQADRNRRDHQRCHD
jgi:hypothetical protein